MNKVFIMKIISVICIINGTERALQEIPLNSLDFKGTLQRLVANTTLRGLVVVISIYTKCLITMNIVPSGRQKPFCPDCPLKENL